MQNAAYKPLRIMGCEPPIPLVPRHNKNYKDMQGVRFDIETTVVLIALKPTLLLLHCILNHDFPDQVQSNISRYM